MGKVIVERCANYDNNNLYKVLKKVIDELGGIDKYIKPGIKVVLKPNLIMEKSPENAATTHPALIKALSSILKEAGCIVTIADSPGGIYNEKILNGVYSVCGLKDALEKMDVTLNYDLGEIEIGNPSGKYFKKIIVIKPLVDADLIINLPKLKTHGQMVYTGAIKNMFGAVPGVKKAEFHLKMPKYVDFANAIIDIFLSVKPTINIMDAVVGMDGDGPTAGNPKKIGLILASENAFDLDFTALNIVNIDPISVPIIKNAIDRGLCTKHMEDIQIIGENIDSVKVSDFKIRVFDPTGAKEFFSKGVFKIIANMIKPRPMFIHKSCKKCFICAKNCPLQIIKMVEGKLQFDASKCIRCFCCQELCPAKAVVIRESRIAKVIIPMSFYIRRYILKFKKLVSSKKQ